jgi:hypothetical protein
MSDGDALARAGHAVSRQLCLGGGEYSRAHRCHPHALQQWWRQVPFFKTFTSSIVKLDTKKTAHTVVIEAVAAVVAFNIAGLSGIGGLWAENGLRAKPSVKCGPTAHCAFPGVCNTIWLEVENCTAAFSVDVLGSEITEESASVRYGMGTTSLAEGTYPFTMHFPVNDNRTWTYVPISGSYTLTAVADATQSKAWLCQNATCPPARFISATGGTLPLVVHVDARDVDGSAIQRAGEALTVTVRAPDGSELSVQAVFDAPSKTYQAAIPGLVHAGPHRVLLTTALATRAVEVAKLELECAPGHVAEEAVQMQCVPEQKRCADDEYKDASGACKGHPTMAVSGSSTSLSIQVRKTNITKTAYGIAEVRLTSGNVEESAPVQWTAAVPGKDAAWLSCKLLNGTDSQLQVKGEVHGRSPASQFQVTVDASGLNDTRGAALYSSSIAIASTVTSYSAGDAVTFTHGSDQLHLPVSVVVVAAAYLTEADVTIFSKANREPVSPSSSSVAVGTSLIVAVQTRDCDRLVIDRPDQQLRLVLTSTLGGFRPRNVTLWYKECEHCAGVFEAELPGTALDNPGAYQLRIRSEDSAVTRTVTMFDPSGAQLAQGALLGSLAACILAVMLVMIYRNPKRAKQLLLSFVTNEFKMLLATISDVWDIVGMRAPSAGLARSMASSTH